MKLLYIDCSMGCAGDMLSAALLELCRDKAEELKKLGAMGIPGVEYTAETAEKCGVSGTRLHVKYLGDEEGADEGHHHGGHLGDIKAVIAALNMPRKARDDALAVYDLLAGAEAKAHGCEMEHIHFHELGTMDAVADVCAASLLMNELGADRVICSPVRTGFGTVKCAHGILPVPAPAAASLLQGVPIYAGDIEGEMCTPTWAALLKHFVSSFGVLPPMTVSAVGYGMGSRDFPQANCVRAMLGEDAGEAVELECDVDDMTPEDAGYAMGVLRKAGALDVSWQPSGMKKDRPGMRISCLCRPEDRDGMVKLIFKYTTTIGIRETLCTRFVLKRRMGTAETPWGPVRVKISEGFGIQRRKPEFDDIAAISDRAGVSPAEVRRTITEVKDDA